MIPAKTNVALKEWAVTVLALEQGQQLFLLRKGGIREEGKAFQVPYSRFLLYPTYEHQSADQLKAGSQQALHDVLAQPRDPGIITFTSWAEVHQVMELSDPDTVDALSPYHIWSADYPQQRLRWKPRSPLHLLVLRVHRLSQPVSVPYQAKYGGCRSWVELEQQVNVEGSAPVLSDAEFSRRVDGVTKVAALPVASG